MSLFTRFLLALALVFPALGADHVVLTNGDTITGSIVKKDGDKLTVKSEFLGEVTMPWSAVKSLTSDTELNVVLPTGETVKGKVATTGDQLQVTAAGAPKTAPLTGITAVRNAVEQEHYERLQHPGLLELWTGNFDIGYSLARGNARSDTLVTGFGATRATRNDKISAYLSQIYSSARTNNVTSTIASSIRGGWKYNRNFDGSLFITGFNDYEHDKFQNLDLRFVAGGGLGIRLVKKENAQLDADAGVNYQRENFSTNVHRNSAEANFGDNLAYNFSKTVSLTQAARMFFNLTNTGEYRANFDLSTNTVLKRWLSWHITGSDRFVSNPLVGRQKNDLVLSTGLRITFAH